MKTVKHRFEYENTGFPHFAQRISFKERLCTSNLCKTNQFFQSERENMIQSPAPLPAFAFITQMQTQNLYIMHKIKLFCNNWSFFQCCSCPIHLFSYVVLFFPFKEFLGYFFLPWIQVYSIFLIYGFFFFSGIHGVATS